MEALPRRALGSRQERGTFRSDLRRDNANFLAARRINWMQQTLERTMTNIENTKTMLMRGRSGSRTVYGRVLARDDPKQIAKLGLYQDEAAQVAKEVRRLADEEIEKASAENLSERSSP